MNLCTLISLFFLCFVFCTLIVQILTSLVFTSIRNVIENTLFTVLSSSLPVKLFDFSVYLQWHGQCSTAIILYWKPVFTHQPPVAAKIESCVLFIERIEHSFIQCFGVYVESIPLVNKILKHWWDGWKKTEDLWSCEKCCQTKEAQSINFKLSNQLL